MGAIKVDAWARTDGIGNHNMLDGISLSECRSVSARDYIEHSANKELRVPKDRSQERVMTLLEFIEMGTIEEGALAVFLYAHEDYPLGRLGRAGEMATKYGGKKFYIKCNGRAFHKDSGKPRIYEVRDKWE